MIGRSVGVVALCLALGACAHDVSQHAMTGADGHAMGAPELTFENGESVSTGIVTYPGGDRIDWKVIEIPPEAKAKLDFKLTWVPPRPGLQLKFDLFDQYWHPIGASTKQAKKQRGRRTTGRVRTATLTEATGKVYVRIYAADRGDAGQYRMTVEYTDIPKPLSVPPGSIQVNPPPHLPDLDAAPFVCTPQNFDMTKDTCTDVCPLVNQPPDWPGCRGKCVLSAPDVDLESCQQVMACPSPPDQRVKRCTPIEKYWLPCPDPANPDPSNPRCTNAKVPPAIGRIVGKSIVGAQTQFTIAVGSDAGVTTSWSCSVLQGKDVGLEGTALSGGACRIIRVEAHRTTATTSLTPDQLSGNNTARLQLVKK